MNLLDSFPFAEESPCLAFKESSLLIFHELVADYSAICGRIFRLKRISDGEAVRPPRLILKTVLRGCDIGTLIFLK